MDGIEIGYDVCIEPDKFIGMLSNWALNQAADDDFNKEKMIAYKEMIDFIADYMGELHG